MAVEVVQVPIGELIAASYNPRALTKAEARQLRRSIERFGFVDPVIVNGHPSRRNVIVGGHQRVQVAKQMGYETVPVVYVEIEDEQRERELNLRLNRNVGHFENDLLAGFEPSLLRDVGFTDQELARIFAEPESDDEPEIAFSEEMLEEHQYVVLYFDNQIDWTRFLSIYPLAPVRSLKSGGTYNQVGIGRVVRGTAFLDAVLGEGAGR